MKNTWQRHTLRFKLSVWYAVGGTVMLAGFSMTLYFYVADRMGRPLAHELSLDFNEVQQKVSVTPDRRILWRGNEVAPFAPWTTEYPWFELWDANSQLVCRLWPFAENRVVQAPSAPFRGRETLAIYNVAPDLRLRVYSVPIRLPGHDDEWMIRLMRIHEPTGDALGALRLIIFVALPIVVALLVIGGYVVTRRWLKPLDSMVAEADRITADDLSRRLTVVNPHDELGRLASVFNVTLDRLQASFDALDRFVADASHELRTPLTTLRSVGEVGLRRSRTVEEYREIIASMLEESQRLQLLTQRLLELASAEGGAAVLQRSEVRIDEYVRSCVGELSILAEARNQHFEIETEPCSANLDVVIFRQALQNLIDNAVKYSPDDSTIRVVVSDRQDTIEVLVIDEGPGITSENRTRLTERFFRPDRGRGRQSGGFGLGLSITKAYMRALGGALEHEPAQPHGSTFRLLVPKAKTGTSAQIANASTPPMATAP
jgi:two-component system, OmpR family, sensor kinase